jgi:hypothetical protein
MFANIAFDNVRVYNAQRFDVAIGQTFRVELIQAEPGVRWFANNDAVLEIAEDADGLNATIRTKAVGTSEIQLQRADGATLIALYIETFDVNRATALNPQGGNAEPK